MPETNKNNLEEAFKAYEQLRLKLVREHYNAVENSKGLIAAEMSIRQQQAFIKKAFIRSNQLNARGEYIKKTMSMLRAEHKKIRISLRVFQNAMAINYPLDHTNVQAKLKQQRIALFQLEAQMQLLDAECEKLPALIQRTLEDIDKIEKMQLLTFNVESLASIESKDVLNAEYLEDVAGKDSDN